MDETHYRKAFEEACHILNLRTGLVGWTEYINHLVESGLTESHCAECNGSGKPEPTRIIGSSFIEDEMSFCSKCDGTRFVPKEKQT